MTIAARRRHPRRASRHILPAARNREVADGELFIARVIVDHEGHVVGARIVRGFGGHARRAGPPA